MNRLLIPFLVLAAAPTAGACGAPADVGLKADRPGPERAAPERMTPERMTPERAAPERAPPGFRSSEPMSQTPTAPQSPAAVTMDQALGQWLLSGEGSADCLLMLQRTRSALGHGVHLERCAGGEFARVAAWRTTGAALELLDADGAVVGRFTPDGPNAWTGRDARGRAARLESAPVY